MYTERNHFWLVRKELREKELSKFFQVLWGRGGPDVIFCDRLSYQPQSSPPDNGNLHPQPCLGLLEAEYMSPTHWYWSSPCDLLCPAENGGRSTLPLVSLGSMSYSLRFCGCHGRALPGGCWDCSPGLRMLIIHGSHLSPTPSSFRAQPPAASEPSQTHTLKEKPQRCLA